MSTVPCGESIDFDILRVGSCRSMIRAPDLGDVGLGHDEGVAVAAVEPLGDVAGELEVLALVVAHGHPVGVVEEDVGGHQRRVGEQPGRHELLPVGLLLELRHAAQLAEAGRALHQPGQLGVLGDVALDEQGAASGSMPLAR